jgi:enamine deaminase RidA (YjgF/YER057c/UK114 family)
MTCEPPTSTLVIVKALANEDYLVEIEAIAVI